ncbi:MAG: IPT/TIG domain-containing protein [Caldimonas sp.]
MVRQSTDNTHGGEAMRDLSSRGSARWIGRSFATALLALVAACGGGSSPPPPPPPATATLTSIAPASAVAGSGAFTLTVNGSGFVSGSVVSLASSTLTTTFVSADQVTAAVPASAVSTSGSLNVLVTNPASGASNALNFSVTAPVVVPLTITSLSPPTLGAGSAAFTLTVDGTGFAATSQVSFNGTLLPTTFVSSTRLTASAPALAAAATLPVLVVDGATRSSVVNFDVTADAFPAVLSPSYFNVNILGDRASTLANADATGRFVVFQSNATNLVAGDLSDGTYSSIYLRDTCLGATPACVPATRLISLDPAGTQCVAPAGSGIGSVYPIVSVDGRFVVFGTNACFAAPLANVRQIALRDTCTTASGPVAGCTPSTTLVSANATGQPSTGSGTSMIPNASMSRNGRYVAWSSTATDLVAGVGNGGFAQLYLRDRCQTSAGAVAGCVAQTIRVSGGAAASANYDAADQFTAISDDGIVVFHTSASNLVANPGLLPGSGGAVFRADCGGGVSLCALSIVSIVPGSGTSSSGILLDSQLPTISRDGRYIGFLSQGENSTGSLVTTPPPNLPNPNLALPGRQAMLLDTCVSAGVVVPSCTTKFSYQSVLDNGNLDITLAAQASSQPSFSDDGRYMAFVAPYNLSPLYPGGGGSVYVRDTCGGASAPPGCVPHIALVSVDSTRVAAGTVGWARISGDGHFVVFDSLSRSPAGTSGSLPIGQIVMVRTGF